MDTRNAWLAALAMLAAGAAAGDEDIAAAGANWISASLKSGELHEECVALKAADRLDYAFVASDRLDFNINYFRGAAVHFLVKKSGVRRAQAVFSPALARDYCMMWSNPGTQTVEFRYRFGVRRN